MTKFSVLYVLVTFPKNLMAEIALGKRSASVSKCA